MISFNHSSSKDHPEQLFPVFSFSRIDNAGPFAFSLENIAGKEKLILEKLMEFSQMDWGRIDNETHDNDRSSSHYISILECSKKAQDRFIELFGSLNVPQASQLYSLRLNNMIRIFGLRQDELFSILWFDPHHQVCPEKYEN